MTQELSTTETESLVSAVFADEEGHGQLEPMIKTSPQSVGHIRRSSFDLEAPSQESAVHRRSHSLNLSHIFESVRTLSIDLQPIREDVKETVQQIKDAFVGDLDRLDQGETGFFDMSMTQALSVLPESFPDLVEEAGIRNTCEPCPQDQPSEEDTATKLDDNQLYHYITLFVAVAAVSSNATALHMLNGVHAPLKLYWRMTASYCALFFLAARSLSEKGAPNLSLAQWLTFLAAVFCYSIQGILFISALDYTAIGNAVNYANSQALLLIIGKIFVGERISYFEGGGVLVAFTGAVLCSRDESQGTSPEALGGHTGLGDCLALLSAVAGVGYLTFAKAVRSQIPVTLFIFGVMFFGSFLVLFYMLVDPYETVQFNMDKNVGVFGWLTVSDFRLPILIYLALVVNMIGTMGFVRGKSFGVRSEVDC